MQDRTLERQAMIKKQIAGRGIKDPAVLGAMQIVPRERFMAEDLAEFAYEDSPLPIGREQTISQPYIVALMTELLHLKPTDKVLEIGTGSGYAAAVLSQIAGKVYSVERHGELLSIARKRFEELGYTNIEVRHGDGTLGWTEHAPYNGIVVAAGGPSVPQALLDQLAIGGRLVIPVGDDSSTQRLLRITRVKAEDFRREDLGSVRFVRLISEQD